MTSIYNYDILLKTNQLNQQKLHISEDFFAYNLQKTQELNILSNGSHYIEFSNELIKKSNR